MRFHQRVLKRYISPAAVSLWVLLSIVATGAAADELCVKSVGSAMSVDGIVAPGVSSGMCPADTLWPGVGPAEFQPGGSSPAAYLRIARINSTNRLRIGVDVADDADVSNFDAVLLFFDANNSGSWDDQDFALRVRTSPVDTVINSGEDCSLTTGAVEYFQYNSAESTWDLDNAASDVTASYAYDYDKPDSEADVWNLEFEFPINAGDPFHLNTAGNYFAVGGYVFVDTGHNQESQLGTVLAWPGAVESEQTGELPDITFMLLPLQVMAPAPNTLANINLEDVCFDVNFTTHSWQINGIDSESGDNHLNRTGDNDFRVGYYFDGPGDDPQPISNPGTVSMRLTPYRAGGADDPWITPIEIDSETYNFNQLHMTDTVTLNFPGEFSSTDDINFICAKLELVDFQLDDLTSNNLKSINHNYFTTSTYEQTVEISSAGIPDLQPGETASVWLNVTSNNEHSDVRKFIKAAQVQTRAQPAGEGQDDLNQQLITLAILILIMILLVFLVFRKNSIIRILAILILLILLALFLYLLYQKFAGNGGGDGTVDAPVGNPRWQVTNAAELGIKPIAGRPGWYEVPIAHGETKRLNVQFQGQPLPYTPERMRLEPVVNGEPNRLDIPVEPGQIVTVIATGKVDVDGEGPLAPTMAGGFTEQTVIEEAAGDEGGNADTQRAATMRNFYGENVPLIPDFRLKKEIIAAQPDGIAVRGPDRRYPLTAGYYQPHQFAGALAGWFHGTETSSGTFVLGRATSVIVPEGVNTLSVFVNAQWQVYPGITGFYDLVVINTPAPTVPTRTVPGGDATYRLPPQLPSWLVLTSVNMYTFYPDVLVNENLTSTTLRPLGDAHFSIYDSHIDTFNADFNQAILQ